MKSRSRHGVVQTVEVFALPGEAEIDDDEQLSLGGFNFDDGAPFTGTHHADTTIKEIYEKYLLRHCKSSTVFQNLEFHPLAGNMHLRRTMIRLFTL